MGVCHGKQGCHTLVTHGSSWSQGRGAKSALLELSQHRVLTPETSETVTQTRGDTEPREGLRVPNSTLTPPLHDSQDQQTPSAHHKTTQIPRVVRRRNPQLWGWVLGCRSYKGEAVPRILGGLGSALTSVTSLSTTPSLSPTRLHSGEPRPDGHGCPDPAEPRNSALPGSTRPWRNPRCHEELSTEATGHRPEWQSLGNDPMGTGGSGRESAVL